MARKERTFIKGRMDDGKEGMVREGSRTEEPDTVRFTGKPTGK